jgi:hypothetical protein
MLSEWNKWKLVDSKNLNVERLLKETERKTRSLLIEKYAHEVLLKTMPQALDQVQLDTLLTLDTSQILSKLMSLNKMSFLGYSIMLKLL